MDKKTLTALPQIMAEIDISYERFVNYYEDLRSRRRIDNFKQGAARLVDPGIGGYAYGRSYPAYYHGEFAFCEHEFISFRCPLMCGGVEMCDVEYEALYDDTYQDHAKQLLDDFEESIRKEEKAKARQKKLDADQKERQDRLTYEALKERFEPQSIHTTTEE